MIPRIRKGEDFSGVPMPELISDFRLQYGIWEFKRKKYCEPFYLSGISRTGLKELLERNGFYKLESDSSFIVREHDGVLSEASIPIIQEFMESELKSLPNSGLEFSFDNEKITASLIALKDTYYRQFHLSINDRHLGHLAILPKTILSDTGNIAYVPFSNGVVEIMARGFDIISYEDLGDNCVWEKQIVPYEFYAGEVNRNECEFVKFLNNVTENDEKRFAAFKAGIGYLMHAYSRPSDGHAVILYDEDITDISQPQGGTGKGVVANAIKQVRPVTKIDGKRFDPSDRFNFQTVKPFTQVVWLDDVLKNFDFSILYSCLTDGLTIERKNREAFLIEPEKSPKFLLCSNSILNTKGKSNKRRQFILELSSYYSERIKSGTEEPIVEEHGGYFFSDESWDTKEWDCFYSFMIECIQFYLANGLVGYESKNVASNRLAQTTSEEFFEWTEKQQFELEKRYKTKELFEEFKLTYYGEDSKFNQRGLTKWLKQFASTNGWKHRSSRSNNVSYFVFSVG